MLIFSDYLMQNNTFLWNNINSQNYSCILVCSTENIRICMFSILVTNKFSRDLTSFSTNDKYRRFFIGLYIRLYIKVHIRLQVLSVCIKEELLKKKKKKSWFFFLTNGHEITGWHLPLQVIPVRLLHVRIQTAPSINGRPKINVAWKLCSKTVTAQFKVWPSENGGVRWKNYFMPCTKANNTVQRDFQLIFLYI